MLASVIEIHNLDGAGELFFTDVPDPVGTVAHHHLDERPTPAALMCFGVNPAGEFGGRFDGAHVGRGGFIAHRPTLVIGSGLREDATEFGLAGVGPSVFSFSASPLGLFGYHRQASAVHLHIDLRSTRHRPSPACGAPLERTPCLRYPVRRRQETALADSGRTNSKRAAFEQDPER